MPIRERLGFAVGDLGNNLCLAAINFFLLYAYTDLFGIAPATAGAIFAAALIWDAVTDPVIGAWSSRTRGHLGTYWPWIAWGAVPFGLSFWAVFALPLALPTQAALMALLTHLLFRTVFTVVSVPYTALSAAMTRDAGERAILTGLHMGAALTANLVMAVATLGLAERLGGRETGRGLAVVAAAYGAVAAALWLVTVAAVRERHAPPAGEAPSAAEMARLIGTNRPLLILMAAVVVGLGGTSVFTGGVVYYLAHVSGAGVDEGAALGVLLVSSFACLPVFVWVARRWSKRTAWLSGTLFGLTGFAIMAIAPPQAAMGLLLVFALLGVGNAAFLVAFWSMLPDTVEYGEWRTGLRAEGLIFGLNQLALKAATGLGVGGLGVALGAVGYEAGTPPSAEVAAAMGRVIVLTPLVLIGAGWFIVLAYPLGPKEHARIVAEIDARRAPA